jgi:2-methylisocitrate lyase-like PEP mutase family enzyme
MVHEVHVQAGTARASPGVWCCCVAQGRNIHEATKHIPIIGDGDTGYGNAMNVKRTVRGYAAAGFAGGRAGESDRGQLW